MPGNWFIEYKEVRKYKEFQNFIVMDSEGVYHTIPYSKQICFEYNYYFEIWDNCHEFGLPEGGDWTKNPYWLVNFMKMFNRIYDQIINYRKA